MRVFVYDELEKVKGRSDKEKDTDNELELMPGEFNRFIDGVYDKGIFTWTEGGYHLGRLRWGQKRRNMDILFNKTVRLPIGKKNQNVNCAKAVFDGMNFVQIGWGLASSISPAERQLSRANLVRDYENMKLSDEKKMTKPTDFLNNILPWLVIIACIVAIAAMSYNASTLKDSQTPILTAMNRTANQNAAILKFLMANATITSKNRTT